MFSVPVLIMAWRRPHTLRRVIDAIRQVAPTRLFVACDGPNPNRPGEEQKVTATRAIIENEIDWPCRIERLYSDSNQGCSDGPIHAINWFFEHVEEGIILEDDCVPHPDFFPYCSSLLNRYRSDFRVWCISGSNFQNGQWHGDGSYYFSRYTHCWGWASWRTRWKHYDARLQQWPALKNCNLLETIFEDPKELKYWQEIWQHTYMRTTPVTWWDYQWTFTCLVNGGLTALPNRNLVNNVGFGKDATHTIGRQINTSIEKGIDPSQLPSFILRNSHADRYTFDHLFGGRWQRLPLSLLRWPRRIIGFLARKLSPRTP